MNIVSFSRTFWRGSAFTILPIILVLLNRSPVGPYFLLSSRRTPINPAYLEERFDTPISAAFTLSLIHISEPTRLLSISYAVFCLKKKKKQQKITNQVDHYKQQQKPNNN